MNRTFDEDSVNSLQAALSAWQGFFAGLVLVVLSVIGFRVFGFWASFSFLPIIGIYFWPAIASRSWSYFLLFLLGMFNDVISNGVLGVSSVLYVFLYLLLGGGLDTKIKFTQAFSGFLFLCALSIIGLLFLGRMALGEWPSIIELSFEAIMAIILFPFLFFLRHLYLKFANPRNFEAV